MLQGHFLIRRSAMRAFDPNLTFVSDLNVRNHFFRHKRLVAIRAFDPVGVGLHEMGHGHVGRHGLGPIGAEIAIRPLAPQRPEIRVMSPHRGLDAPILVIQLHVLVQLERLFRLKIARRTLDDSGFFVRVPDVFLHLGVGDGAEIASSALFRVVSGHVSGQLDPGDESISANRAPEFGVMSLGHVILETFAFGQKLFANSAISLQRRGRVSVFRRRNSVRAFDVIVSVMQSAQLQPANRTNDLGHAVMKHVSMHLEDVRIRSREIANVARIR